MCENKCYKLIKKILGKYDIKIIQDDNKYLLKDVKRNIIIHESNSIDELYLYLECYL